MENIGNIDNEIIETGDKVRDLLIDSLEKVEGGNTEKSLETTSETTRTKHRKRSYTSSNFRNKLNRKGITRRN